MTHPGPLVAVSPGLADFLLKWGELLACAEFPAVIIDFHSTRVALVNPAAVTALGSTPAQLAELCPSAEAARAVLDGVATAGRWIGELREGLSGEAVVIRGPGGAAEGVYLAVIPGEVHVAPLVRSLVEGAESIFLAVDAAGRIAWANAEARRLLDPAGGFLVCAAPPGALVALNVGAATSRHLIGRDGASRSVAWRRVELGEGLRGLWGRDASDAVEIARALELRVRRVGALHDVSGAVARGLPIAQVAALALLRIEELLRVRTVRVTLAEGDTLRPLASRRGGEPVVTEERVLLAGSPASLARGGPMQRTIEDAQELPVLRSLAVTGVRQALIVPLQKEEQAVLGFLEVYGDGEPYTVGEVEVVNHIADALSGAIARERLIEQMSRHAAAMEQRIARRNEEIDRTNEQLVQAVKLSSIGELTAGLVHELNQPLNVMGGYVELLLQGAMPEPARVRALEIMGRAVARMTALAGNLRNFSRSEGPLMVPLDLGEVVASARELTAGAVMRGVTIDCPTGIRVNGSATRLGQVVVNILANALQSGGGPVSLCVRVEDDRAVIEVADSGPGVPQALRDRVFDAFYTTKPRGQGTGLGLSVSARIVQEHGGRIEVDEHEGGGALFRVVLPLHEG